MTFFSLYKFPLGYQSTTVLFQLKYPPNIQAITWNQRLLIRGESGSDNDIFHKKTQRYICLCLFLSRVEYRYLSYGRICNYSTWVSVIQS